MRTLIPLKHLVLCQCSRRSDAPGLSTLCVAEPSGTFAVCRQHERDWGAKGNSAHQRHGERPFTRAQFAAKPRCENKESV